MSAVARSLFACLVLLLVSSLASAAYLDVNDPPSLRSVIAEKAVDSQLILFVYTSNNAYGTAWRDMTTQLAFSLERVGHPNYVVVAFDAAACDELRAATPLVTPTCVTNSILRGYANGGANDLWVSAFCRQPGTRAEQLAFPLPFPADARRHSTSA